MPPLSQDHAIPGKNPNIPRERRAFHPVSLHEHVRLLVPSTRAQTWVSSVVGPKTSKGHGLGRQAFALRRHPTSHSGGVRGLFCESVVLNGERSCGAARGRLEAKGGEFSGRLVLISHAECQNDGWMTM